MKTEHKQMVWMGTLVAAMALSLPSVAFAAGSGGTNIIVGGLNSTVDMFITIFGYVGMIAFMAAGSMLLFKHDMPEAFEKIAKVVVATGLVLGGPAIFRTLFSITGAVL